MENATLMDHPDRWTMVYEATPLMIDGRLYTCTSLRQVAAIEARTGQTLWVYDPETHKQGILRGLGPSSRRNALEVGLQNHEAVLHAFDPDTGTLIAEVALPSTASGAPMTYMVEGKQFIVMPIGGASQPAELVALSLL